MELVILRMRVIAQPTRLRLMRLLDEQGGATLAQLAREIPHGSYSGVAKHIGVLHQAGLVRRTRAEGQTRYELEDWTAMWVVQQIIRAVAEQLEQQRRRLTPGPDD